jgi:hypothetical protein
LFEVPKIEVTASRPSLRIFQLALFSCSASFPLICGDISTLGNKSSSTSRSGALDSSPAPLGAGGGAPLVGASGVRLETFSNSLSILLNKFGFKSSTDFLSAVLWS